MGKIEKIIITGVIAFVLVWVGIVGYAAVLVYDAGGIKQVIIDTGKGLKDIGRQINEK